MSGDERFWDNRTVRSILACKSTQLKDLARCAGMDTARAFRNADFRGIDLRNQDLSGVDLGAASFEGAIVDGTTKLDGGAIPIADRATLLREASSLAELAGPHFRRDSLLRDVRNTLSQAIDVCFFFGETMNAFKLATEAIGAPRDNIVETERGYIRRRVLVTPIDSIKYGLEKSLRSVIRKRAPAALKSLEPTGANAIQLSLALGEEALRPLRAASSPELDTKLAIKRFRAMQNVTDIWLVFEGKLTQELCHDIEKIRKMKMRIHFLIGTQRDEVRNWKPKMATRTALIDEKLYTDRGPYGYLSEIEKLSGGSFRFSAEFRRRVGNQRYHQQLFEIVSRAMKDATQRAKIIPVLVGARNLSLVGLPR